MVSNQKESIRFLLFLLIVAIAAPSCRNFGDNTNTPVTLRSTKDIGELICAEFHGEVYNSFQNVVIDTTINIYKNLFEKVRFIYEMESTKDSSLTLAPKNLINIKDVKDLEPELKSMCGVMGLSGINSFFTRVVNDTLWFNFIQEDDDARPRRRKTIEKTMEENLSDELEKKNIAYIARGSVKAGYDLQNYDFDKYKLIKGDTLILRNLEPQILNADINPWFSEDLRIKGFEMIESDQGRKLTFDEIKRLKIYCRQLLLKEALNLLILESAAESGQEHLQAFYTLLNVNSLNPVNLLLIEPPFLFEEKSNWLEDGEISLSEAQDILAYEKLIQADSLFGFTEPQEVQAYWEKSLKQLNEWTVPGQNSFLWEEFYSSKFRN